MKAEAAPAVGARGADAETEAAPAVGAWGTGGGDSRGGRQAVGVREPEAGSDLRGRCPGAAAGSASAEPRRAEGGAAGVGRKKRW